MNVVYGPVKSWRLGRSIGIDPICIEPKVCTFNCIYCQLGSKGIVTEERSAFVREDVVKEQLGLLLRKKVKAEVITFSGTGEPTLAANLKVLAALVDDMTDIPMAILTNSSLFQYPEVRDAMQLFDILVAKLDASCDLTFRVMNKSHSSIDFQKTLVGIETMRQEFEGSFRMQLMFVRENMNDVEGLAEICDRIEPDLVYLNTPLRPSTTRPLGRGEMRSISRSFARSRSKMIYEGEQERLRNFEGH
ncbi:MAG: radical SAM protein [Methanomassiliicoccales archaeon]|jgi:wyosine [tRNA(Phe)-imidazoG37] synthetase (radical SAM superfamily)